MTPVVKAFQTDLGFEMANLALQVHGGYGYVREYGVEQLVRDARITQIYEGTNGIQALDLVGRKMPAHTGRYLRRFFHPVSEFLDGGGGQPGAGGVRRRRPRRPSSACSAPPPGWRRKR